MKIPKNVVKKKEKYVFIKKCNNNLFLYQNVEHEYIECFSKFDLGLVKQTVEVEIEKNIHPENIKKLSRRIV